MRETVGSICAVCDQAYIDRARQAGSLACLLHTGSALELHVG